VAERGISAPEWMNGLHWIIGTHDSRYMKPSRELFRLKEELNNRI
jgi:hypothetical protein